MESLIHALDLHLFVPGDLLVILVLIVLEGLLSCDNAVVLALLVKDLPPEQRGKALRYGIIGAYVFRILALLVASIIMGVWWLKVLGGVYLVYLCVDWYLKHGGDVGEPTVRPVRRWFGLSAFWSTVVAVELTDIVFSVDSIAAAVALSNKLYVLIIGGLLGILAMRFAAQGFVGLLQRFPLLEACAFAAVGFIGLKLLAEVPVDLWSKPQPVAAYVDSASYRTAADQATVRWIDVHHVVTVTRLAPEPPADEALQRGAEAWVAANQPVLAGEERDLAVRDRFNRERKDAQSWWNLHGRPLVHVEGMIGSTIVLMIFAVGFLRRPRSRAG